MTGLQTGAERASALGCQPAPREPRTCSPARATLRLRMWPGCATNFVCEGMRAGASLSDCLSPETRRSPMCRDLHGLALGAPEAADGDRTRDPQLGNASLRVQVGWIQMRYGLSSGSSPSIVSAESGTTTRTGLPGTGCENRTRCPRHTPLVGRGFSRGDRSHGSGRHRRSLDRRFAATAVARIWVWIYPRTRPRIADPGLRVAVVRCSRGLVACLGPDPAPSPWGFVSGVGPQQGGRLVVDRRGGFGRWGGSRGQGTEERERERHGGGRWLAAEKRGQRRTVARGGW
jgi:hypothetical protein